jgi:hypothetical protein
MLKMNNTMMLCQTLFGIKFIISCLKWYKSDDYVENFRIFEDLKIIRALCRALYMNEMMAN